MRLISARSRLAAPVLAACVASSCGSMGPRGTLPGATPAPVKPGEWGGQHIAMAVAAAKADIEFDCGRATIPTALNADPDGAFSATGTFAPEHAGPVTPDPPATRPMRATGTVRGDDMRVTIVLTDKDETIGDFSLTRGSAARLFKCR